MSSSQTITRLIDRLAEPPREADAAGTALLDAGPAAMPLLVDRFGDAGVAIRRRVAYLLGRYPSGSTLDERRAQVLAEGLADDDWKVRRNAAVSLGRLRATSATPALLDRVDAETDDRVRPSVLLALGRTAGPEHLDRLRQVEPRGERDRDAAAKMLDSVQARTNSDVRIRVDAVPPPGQAVIELWTRAGVSPLAADELEAAGVPAEVVTPDRVRLAAPATLGQIHAVRSVLYPVLAVEIPVPPTRPQALGEAVGTALVPAILSLTTGAPSYRLTLDDAPGTRRRTDWIRAFASGCKPLANRATGYTWELRIRATSAGTLVGARPTAFEDTRFDYREEDVPAALHPTLAAATIRLVGVRGDDVVVDPCCGSGTLLAERALAGPYHRLVGIDHDGRAVAAARRNLERCDAVELRRSDLAALRDVARPTLVVANPPYGRRVSDTRRARTLHRRLDALVTEQLAPGGRYAVFRPPGFDPPAGLKVEREVRVDAGGIPVDVIVAVRSG